jgi:release factor glutamine methyltransferase
VLAGARPSARVVGTELDPRARHCAGRNGVDVRLGHLFDPLPDDLLGAVDVVVGVVPYVPDDALHLLPRDVLAYEPRAALDGGNGGIEVVTEVVASSLRWMRPGGWLLLEVGGDQIGPVEELFTSAGYRQLSVLCDGDGDPRAVEGCLHRP